ncbi:MAG: prephenate dehydrogenase/arogenate dehydrogenase family protein, partial [Limisphaerales bacterium]
MHFRKTALIGVGLLGGSLGLAIQRRNISDRVVGYVRREASIAACQEHGVVDEATMDLAAAVAGADLVIFCTPLAQMRELAATAMPHLKEGAIVTDVGSVKG